ncbi:methyltransferase [Oceanobacillus halophilus]|uniref:Class I SAM-dependent methyltransferase n=1 Tax=Oceanobacillus halophilus TaxID=930130 RepID=A0A494ZTN5_9BACI|nr:methyltransferase [Oceanobacillus halophilus]RKQ29069.1 class I SAM-dependent methyltransferase [Oceanobacillus halophilus]
MKEYYYDKLLNIRTRRDRNNSSGASIHYHPYEPTPYSALEKLFSEYEIKENDRIVDFGCGMGRLNFFVHYFYHASVVGIEMNKDFHEKALINQNEYLKKWKRNTDKIQFLSCLAEDYKIKETDNRFYFFHPFSIQIFRKVIQNILISVEETDRELELILYYAHDDYIYFLDNETYFNLVKEIKLPGLYERNPYEHFLIYRLDYQGKQI